jgi:hypothetical protein
MTTTYTTSSTSSFTLTHAKYLASKLASDLRQMQLFYGKPTDSEIAAYITEVVILLLGGYLATVSYGFKRHGQWILALKYDARAGGVLLPDDRAGRVRPGVDVHGSTWHSFLTYSLKFSHLLEVEQQRVKSQLPFQRGDGSEPTVSGAWVSDKSYSSGTVSLQRNTYAQS